MREALRHVGHRQTRNRGTIGGSLAHADPAAELPAVCAAYDAVLHLASMRGIRQVPFREFSAGYMATALAADEMIAAVELPLWPEGPASASRNLRAATAISPSSARRRLIDARWRRHGAALRAGAVRRRAGASAGRCRRSDAQRAQARSCDDPRGRRRGVADRSDLGYPRQRRLPAPSRAGAEPARTDAKRRVAREWCCERTAHQQTGDAAHCERQVLCAICRGAHDARGFPAS